MGLYLPRILEAFVGRVVPRFGDGRLSFAFAAAKESIVKVFDKETPL